MQKPKERLYNSNNLKLYRLFLVFEKRNLWFDAYNCAEEHSDTFVV